MTEHLESAYKRGTRKKSCLINPISKTDAEIIFELSVALVRIKGAEELRDIVEQWKFLKDEVIKEMLLTWNINNPEGSQPEDESHKRKFINFDGEIVEVGLIKTIGKDNEYDFANTRMQYNIIINKDLEEKYMLTNGIFKYSTEEKRDNKLLGLKKKLRDYIKII
jgi:hypothetical protein